jgi:hypothetical protein
VTTLRVNSMLPAPMNATVTTARQCCIQGQNEQEQALGAHITTQLQSSLSWVKSLTTSLSDEQ